MAHWLWLFWIASSKAPSFSRSKENPIGLVPPNRRALLPIYLPRRPHKPRRFAPPRNQLGGSRRSAKMASFFGATVIHQHDGSRWKLVLESFRSLLKRCGLKRVGIHALR